MVLGPHGTTGRLGCGCEVLKTSPKGARGSLCRPARPRARGACAGACDMSADRQDLESTASCSLQGQVSSSSAIRRVKRPFGATRKGDFGWIQVRGLQESGRKQATSCGQEAQGDSRQEGRGRLESHDAPPEPCNEGVPCKASQER